MTLRDFECLSEIFNDKKPRAGSLPLRLTLNIVVQFRRNHPVGYSNVL